MSTTTEKPLRHFADFTWAEVYAWALKNTQVECTPPSTKHIGTLTATVQGNIGICILGVGESQGEVLADVVTQILQDHRLSRLLDNNIKNRKYPWQ